MVSLTQTQKVELALQLRRLEACNHDDTLPPESHADTDTPAAQEVSSPGRLLPMQGKQPGLVPCVCACVCACVVLAVTTCSWGSEDACLYADPSNRVRGIQQWPWL